MEREGLAHIVLYGANRSGSAVSWLTGWPVTREAHVLVTRGERDVLLVSFFNHVPEARRRAAEADVRFAGDAPAAALVELLGERGAGGAPVGLIGSLPYDQYAVLAEGRRVVDLNRAHTRLRLRKSDEEIAALRTAAALTDAAAAALLEPPVVGRTEHELVARVEQPTCPAAACTTSTTSASPPCRLPTARCRRSGPATGPWPPATCSRSSSAPPSPRSTPASCCAPSAWPPNRLRRCRSCTTSPRLPSPRSPTDCARGARTRLVAAAGVIEEAGFTTVDDLVHGFGGGYLPPVLGSRSRAIRPTPDFILEAGMTVVVQPNVATPDGRLGVQTGELLLVTESGPERLHTFPRGLVRAV